MPLAQRQGYYRDTRTGKLRSKSLYKAVVITPQQTLTILNKLTNPLHYTLVLTCAATYTVRLRSFRCAGRTSLWNDGQIRISKR